MNQLWTQSHLHPSFHPVIHLPPLIHPLFPSSSILPCFHPLIQKPITDHLLYLQSFQPLINYPIVHSLTTPLSTFPSSYTSANHLPIFIHPCYYLLANHWPLIKPLSIPPFCHPSAKQSCTHYFIHLSNLFSISNSLTSHSQIHLYLHLSFISQLFFHSPHLYPSFHPLSHQLAIDPHFPSSSTLLFFHTLIN